MIFAIAWITGTMFMSVWGMAADTILQCFCVDKELSKGKYNNHTPDQLRAFVEDPKAKAAHAAQEERRKQAIADYKARNK